MSVDVGARLGSLEITALLGKGGMGEVYRARDTKLKRDVAVKILPDEFSRDPDRVSRFQREAEVLASLNHPNIAAIYDLQEANGARFLVLELVEGETLAERIQRGAIPVEEVLEISKRICEALEAAHERGIVHRDLKPANVKITPDGRVKVLDFGLAKAFEAQSASATLSNSPTMLNGTIGGMIVGTASYMSPEQARGRSADQRSDVFAFGCVLFEMLAGQQAFQGEDVSDVLASVIKADADFNLLPPNLNSRLSELLRRSLAKNRAERWHAIGDVRLEIEAIMIDPLGLQLPAVQAATRQWKNVVTAAVIAVLAAGLTLVTIRTLQPVQSAEIMRFSFVLPEDQRWTNFGRHVIAISPDGTKIVYVANQRLYLRRITDITAQPIAGTAMESGVTSPFFSSDGRWVGFYSLSDRKLKKIAIGGGAAVTLCDAENPFGVTWDSDDQIYFSQGQRGIMRFSPTAGKPETVVTLKAGEVAQSPQVLPGGDMLLFTVAVVSTIPGHASGWDNAQIVVQSLKTGERRLVVQGGSDARYVSTGHLVYALGSTLFAAHFDLRKLQLKSTPVPIAENVERPQGGVTGAAQFAFSSKGSMVYIPSQKHGSENRTVALVDAAGVRAPLNIPPGPYNHPRVSLADGKLLALQTNDGSNAHIWIYDLTGSTPIRQLTFAGRDDFPIWTRDGQRVVFMSERETDGGLYWQRADGASPAEQLLKAEPGVLLRPETWSENDKALFFSVNPTTRGFIRTLSLGAAPQTLIEAFALSSNLSRDGHWLAYTSQGELYVQPFPLTGAKYRITSGAHFPQWSLDGRQLFYATDDTGPDGTSRLVSVDIQTQPVFSVRKQTPLPVEGIVSNGERGGFAVMPDSQHFIVLLPPSQAERGNVSAGQINITINWFEELNQRVPLH
jgi:serine/threonine-protein kinase